MGKNKVLQKLALAFGVTAGILIGVGLIVGFVMNSSFNSSEKVTAVIEALSGDNDDESTAYVRYEYNGQQYDHVNLHCYYSSMRVGDEIQVYLKPEKPTNVHMKFELYLTCGILMGVGVIFLIIAICFAVINTAGTSRKRKLKENGQRIYATITQIRQNTMVKINHRHPYIVECSYEDPQTGKSYVFHSENLFFDPREYMNDSMIPVYVERGNYQHYYVDVAEINRNHTRYLS